MGALFAVASGAVTLGGVGQPGDAAPWARDPAEVFLSYSVSVDTTRDEISSGSLDPDIFQSLYSEVGLGRRLTLGVDVGGDDEDTLGAAFVRYTFTRNAAIWQVATDLGFGLREDGGEEAELFRTGFSVGRGFTRGTLDWLPFVDPRGGWFSIDSSAYIDPDGDQSLWQSEATFGVNFTDRYAAMMQLKVEEYPGSDFSVFISPSVLATVGEATTLQAGGRFGVEGSEDVGLRLGVWREF
ncbi:MAG: hypothetical protein AAGC82_10855 [Pseudomonadota bacterium]